MIYVYQLLRQIRLNNLFNANATAKHLGITTNQLSKLENTFIPISDTTLEDWMTYLDIPKKEQPWYQQKHLRETAYNFLTTHSPKGTPEPLIHRLADVITFQREINITEVCVQLQKHTITHVLPRPRSADVVMDDLKDATH